MAHPTGAKVARAVSVMVVRAVCVMVAHASCAMVASSAQGDEEASSASVGMAVHVLQGTMMVSEVLSLCNEGLQLVREGSTIYFSGPWNLVDVSASVSLTESTFIDNNNFFDNGGGLSIWSGASASGARVVVSEETRCFFCCRWSCSC